MFCTLFLLFASVAAIRYTPRPHPGPFGPIRYAAEDIEDTAYGLINIGCGGNDKKHKKLAFKPEDVEDKIDIGLHVVIGNDGKKYLVMAPEDVDDRIKFDGHLVIDEAGKIHTFDAEDIEDTAYGVLNIGCGGNDKRHKKVRFTREDLEDRIKFDGHLVIDEAGKMHIFDAEDIEDTAYGLINIGCGGNDKKHKKLAFKPEDVEDKIDIGLHVVIGNDGKKYLVMAPEEVEDRLYFPTHPIGPFAW